MISEISNENFIIDEEGRTISLAKFLFVSAAMNIPPQNRPNNYGSSSRSEILSPRRPRLAAGSSFLRFEQIGKTWQF
jgi:hypothetical protein